MAKHNKVIEKEKEERKKVPHNRDEVIEQLQMAGFQADSFPDSMLALFAAIWGVRSDMQDLTDSIDAMGAVIEEYCFEE